MKFEIELPEKYASRLEEVSAVEPTVVDQIEVEVLPVVLRLINDAHRQVHRETDSQSIHVHDDST